MDISAWNSWHDFSLTTTIRVRNALVDSDRRIECLGFIWHVVAPSSIVDTVLHSMSLRLTIRVEASTSTSKVTGHVAAVAKPILLIVEAKLLSHTFPLSIERVSVCMADVSEKILAFRGTSSTSHPLSHDLTSLIVQHALMGHLLMTVSRVLIHLVALSDTIAVSDRSRGLCLVCFFDWITTSISFSRGYGLHLMELPLAHTSSPHVHRLSH